MQQLPEGIFRIPSADLIGHGALCNQDLGDGLVVLRKEFLVYHHKPGLAYRCAGLLLGKAPWPLLDAQRLSPCADGPGGDDDNLLVLISDIR